MTLAMSNSCPSRTVPDLHLSHGNGNMTEDDDNGNKQFVDYEKGFSDDDDGREEAFDRTFRPTKKSPRRSDDNPTKDSPREKKARTQSLFGGDAVPSSEEPDNGNPKTPSQGIRIRMSSLAIDHQDEHIYREGDSNECPLQPKFSIGATSDLTDKADPAQGDPAPLNHSNKLNENSMQGADDPVEAYGLRKNIDRQGVGSSWLDVDKSGDFDPVEEARRIKPKNKKRKGKRKVEQVQRPEERTLKYIVRLSVGRRHIGNLLNRTDGEENWPDGWSVIDREDEREMLEYLALNRQTTPVVVRQKRIADPKGEFDDLTGHPAARGCQDCREADRKCSMIKDGEYPCTHCQEAEIECYPLIESKICERFNRCGDLGHDQPDCRPGSSNMRTVERIDLDQILYGPDRKHATCTYCRRHNMACSLKKKKDKPPCKNCKRNGIGCTFYDVQPLNYSKPTKAKEKRGKDKANNVKEDDTDDGRSKRIRIQDIAPEVSIPGPGDFDDDDLADLYDDYNRDKLREETPEIEVEDADGHKGFMTTLTTSFAHPITFNVIYNDSSICSFCEMPTFCFVGHWEKEVHVLRWSNGLGYTELAAGHREENDPTIMCQECVISRVQLIHCPEHDIRYIDDAHLDYDDAVDQLLTADAGSIQMRCELQRWCSMCFSLASFKCCTTQLPIIEDSDDNSDDNSIDSCGLKLCKNCYTSLRDIYAGDVDAMVTALDMDPKSKGEEDEDVNVRADVGFLRKDGLLMANVGNGTGGDSEAEDELEM